MPSCDIFLGGFIEQHHQHPEALAAIVRSRASGSFLGYSLQYPENMAELELVFLPMGSGPQRLAEALVMKTSSLTHDPMQSTISTSYAPCQIPVKSIQAWHLP